MHLKLAFAALLTIFFSVYVFSQDDGDIAEKDAELNNVSDAQNGENETISPNAAASDSKAPKGPQIDVYAELSSQEIEQNVPFAITVMVNHPNPVEVRVQPPDFEDNFSMDRIRTEIVLLKNKDGITERWTSVEFLLNPLTAGNKYLGSFEVSIPGRTAATKRMRLFVNDEKSIKSGRLQWIGSETWRSPPTSIMVGNMAEAALRLPDGQKGKIAPKQLPLRIEAPQNAVIEDLPVSASDIAAGIYFRIRILPLDEKEVRIAAHNFRFEGRTLSVPALNIKVLAANYESNGKNTASIVSADTYAGQQTDIFVEDESDVNNIPPLADLQINNELNRTPLAGEGLSGKIPFPAFKILSNTFFQKTLQTTAVNAKKLWDEQKYGESVAVLRKAERETLYGRVLTPLREKLEAALLLSDMPAENWHPRFLVIISFVLSIISVSMILFYFWLRIQNKYEKYIAKIFTNTSVLVIWIVFICSLAVFFVMVPKNNNEVILKSTAAGTVPEFTQESDIYFFEGEKANARLKTDEWVYVESASGKTGWVETGKVVFY
ncbi:MAG: hypothetical protein Ta2B_26650 [Termitinemataceae bacterium]|nr:MAG: hypothetical protein Ta2B_26650 [Termitinemataceae bacterium]